MLDPACGSGNFLFLGLKALKDIEHRSHLEAAALGLDREADLVTGPHNVLGIELNEYAAELARVTVWIGELQWRMAHGFEFKTNPVLEPLDHIECRDALLTFPVIARRVATWQSIQKINIDFNEKPIFTIIFVMPKSPIALTQMPLATLSALEQLGADLAVARLRRKESLASWASRMGTSVPTLMRMEAGEPGVGMGIYATALWLVGRISALSELATPATDRDALELDVRAAVSLGKGRAKASAAARLQRRQTKVSAHV